MQDSLEAVRKAIDAGNTRRARHLLRPLLDTPTADIWYTASFVYEQPEHQITCLHRALKLDPGHDQAKWRLKEMRQSSSPSLLKDPLEITDSELAALPALAALIGNIREPVPSSSPVTRHHNVWVSRHKRKRVWTYIGLGASLLLSLSLAYLVLTVLGSEIPAQLRSLVSGSLATNPIEGTPIFGEPSGNDYSLIDNEEINDVDGVVLAVEGENNRISVTISQSKLLEREKPLSDVLDPGYAHEYTFNAAVGEEIAIAVQFFSPTAQQVGSNVAVLDMDSANAEAHCQRDTILQGDTGAAFICQIHQTGIWKVQILGRAGESTGVYVVTVGSF